LNEVRNKVDVLFVGAGPASLAGAIKLKQLLNQKGRTESVVVIEKAEKIGQHNLSGAVFEAGVLDELLPGWRDNKDDQYAAKILANGVARDELFFLAGSGTAIKIPEFVIPPSMNNRGCYVVSLSELVNWLTGIAFKSGVEIYNGFVAKEIIVEDNRVKGIKLGDKGLDKEGKQLANYVPGEIIEAGVTVFGEGSAGLLAEELVRKFSLDKGHSPQIYSLGVKEIVKLPEKNHFGANRVVHTLGFPLPSDIYGGGSIYSLSDHLVTVSLVLALDWRYCNLNPQQELQRFKSHRLIKQLLAGGTVTAYGAKTLPEGGYYAMPDPVADGAVIIGDAAGLTNAKIRKGLHYAIKSGMAAAEAIFQAVEAGDYSKQALGKYRELLAGSFVVKELYAARNYRQVFTGAGRLGYYLGAPLSFLQQWLPAKLNTRPDYKGMHKGAMLNRKSTGIDRLTAVALSGTTHREDEPSHITFKEESQDDSCFKEFGCHPCAFFCPAEVYKFENDKLILSPSNCVHCQTCRIKCPHQVIKWAVPEGGDGPRYKTM